MMAAQGDSSMTVLLRHFVVTLTIFALLSSSVSAGQETQSPAFNPAPTAADCTYLRTPADFEFSPESHRTQRSMWDEQVGTRSAYDAVPGGMRADVASLPVPRKNFSGEYILERMERDGI